MAVVAQKMKVHPYIVKREGVCGGRSIIDGTRIPVWTLIKWYKLGMSLEDIMREFPQLPPSQIHDAFSYYYDHQEEIEYDIQENDNERYFRKMINEKALS